MSVQASGTPSPQVTPTKASLAQQQQHKSAKGNHRSTSALPASPGSLPTPTQTAFETFTAYPFDEGHGIAPSALLPPAMPNVDLHQQSAKQQTQQHLSQQTGSLPQPGSHAGAPFATADFQTGPQMVTRSTASGGSVTGTPSLPMIAFDPQHPPSDDEASGSDGDATGNTPARPRKRKSTVDLRSASRAQSASAPPASEGGGSEPAESARRKITIEYIEDKSKRHITFSKRKAGIMKKAYELSTLTGTQVLLLVVSESGWVYTFTTDKFKPLVKEDENGQLSEGQRLIAACLQQPDAPAPAPQGNGYGASTSQFEGGGNEVIARRRPIASNRRVSSRGRIPAAIRTDGPVPPVPQIPNGMVQYLDQPALTPTSPTRLPVTPTRGSSMQQAQQQMLAMGGPRSGPVDYPQDLAYGAYDQGGLYADAYAKMPGSAPPTYHYNMHDYGNGAGYHGDPTQSSPHYTTQPDPHMMMSHLHIHGGGHAQGGHGQQQPQQQQQPTPSGHRQQQQQQQMHIHPGAYHDDWVPRDHR